ncbi:hypothetical protein QQF64_029426 [Cirrhinus molitorella]|uniref:Uncharacterized protein n=1 Tax=Cirrhinus molitorella TaxID=172907 RepID=A0ABR3N0F7_9TELE
MTPSAHVCFLKLVRSQTSMPNYDKLHIITQPTGTLVLALVRKSRPKLSHSNARESSRSVALYHRMGGVILPSGWSYLSWGAIVERREHMDRMFACQSRERHRERNSNV